MTSSKNINDVLTPKPFSRQGRSRDLSELHVVADFIAQIVEPTPAVNLL
ncbi:MAG: hypothetical protein QXP58_01975 [Thermoprotei archaeon]